jgi:signal transduction histidine kinase
MSQSMPALLKQISALIIQNQSLGKRPELEQSIQNDPMKTYTGSPNIVDYSEKNRGEKLCEQQSLLKQMLHFHERDRQLIAYELHDGLVQDITAAQMLLNYSIKSGNLPAGEAGEQVQEASRLVQKAVDEARRLIGGLRPPILEEMGVVSAISYLIDNLPHNKITIDFSAKVQSERFEPLLEAAIYRIVQQAINNIQRHSRANRAEIALTQQGIWIHLEIQDSGIGFDPSSVSEDRFGIQGIRERARLMRGRAVIDSAPGKGTRINVDLPVA